jgi:transcriptional regulator
MTNENLCHKPSLTFEQAIEVWLLHWQGLYQHQIAARLFTNPGRINDVLKERKHIGSREAALSGRSA